MSLQIHKYSNVDQEVYNVHSLDNNSLLSSIYLSMVKTDNIEYEESFTRPDFLDGMLAVNAFELGTTLIVMPFTHLLSDEYMYLPEE